MKVEFAVVSDVYEAGHRDDGTPFIGERYFVSAEVEDGRRFRYHKDWAGVEAFPNEEDGGSFFRDVRPRAVALAEAVCRTVAKDTFNPNSDNWYEARPVYGSDAYIVQQLEGAMMDRQDFDDGFNAWDAASGFYGNY